jgi:hypothetical protein
MKTLIYTSIYSNLWGTEFGGRSSRHHHYRLSLKNILNLNADKFICFVPIEELEDLKKHFYNMWGVSQDKLEFVVFDLHNTKYFDEIRKLKDLEKMKTIDRCFEVQYNKFFWYDMLENKDQYERIYWFDAGLSHGGLFPDNLAYGSGFDRHFSFKCFNEGFLTKLNTLSEDKFILVGKSNTGRFFWSQTIPQQYYTEFKRDYHVVGGFFGGKLEVFNLFKEKFNTLLVNLLTNEPVLYMEEQILSCLYYENIGHINLLTFDDWYRREDHNTNDIKYFYNLFEI